MDVATTLVQGIIDQTLLLAVGASLKRLIIGYGLAIIIGVLLGTLIARFSLLSDTIGRAIMALQTIPSIAWLPIAILWFGIGDQAIIFVVALGATWTMTLNTESGIRSVDRVYISAAKMMNVKGVKLFTKVMLPAAIPQMITGMRMAWAFAWRALLAGELIGSGTGLGQVLMLGRNLGDMSLVLAVIIIIAIQGSLVDHFIFRKVEDNILVRWGLKKDDGKKVKQKGPLRKWAPIALVVAIIGVIAVSSLSGSKANEETVRFGFLPNITHMPALVGLQSGKFEDELQGVTIEAHHFDGGPTLMEALSAGQIDVAYVGPGPAITNYLNSQGSRIIAGVTDGGTVLVASPEITTVDDLDGKRVAVPQLGNTQDIQLRHVLEQKGLKDKKLGGTVDIIQSAPADMVTLFLQGEIDAAIVPEPWGSQLIDKTEAVILVDSNDIWKNGEYPTTVVIVREAFKQQHPEVVEQFIQAHVNVISFIENHPEESKTLFNVKLKELTNKELPEDVIGSSLERIKITSEINEETLLEFAELSAQAGYVKKPFDLHGMVDLEFITKTR